MGKLPPAERGLQEFHQHCMEGAGSDGGTMQMVIARVEQLLAYQRSPEPLHQAVAQSIFIFNKSLASGKRVMCLLCDYEFGLSLPTSLNLLAVLQAAASIPPAYAILFPYRLDIKSSLASPLCETCSRRSDADLMAAATVKYREAWPKLRRLELCPSPVIKQ